METAVVPKFKWETIDERNSGHTKDEWGIQKDIPKIRNMEVYDLKWNVKRQKI
jgi:hypothetical protein